MCEKSFSFLLQVESLNIFKMLLPAEGFCVISLMTCHRACNVCNVLFVYELTYNACRCPGNYELAESFSICQSCLNGSAAELFIKRPGKAHQHLHILLVKFGCLLKIINRCLHNVEHPLIDSISVSLRVQIKPHFGGGRQIDSMSYLRFSCRKSSDNAIYYLSVCTRRLAGRNFRFHVSIYQIFIIILLLL